MAHIAGYPDDFSCTPKQTTVNFIPPLLFVLAVLVFDACAQRCYDYCEDKGYYYYAVQWSIECW